MTKTFFRNAAESISARATVVVVLPTPPFRLITETTVAIGTLLVLSHAFTCGALKTGPERSDEGSATDIGRRAVEVAVEAGRKSTHASPLARALCEQLGLANTEDLKPLVRGYQGNADWAALFPAVVSAARQGDAEALAVLLAAGDALAGLAQKVLQVLELKETDTLVAVTGGVFSGSAEVFHQVEQRLRVWSPLIRVALLSRTPAEGAVLLAQRLWLQAGAGAGAVR